MRLSSSGMLATIMVASVVLAGCSYPSSDGPLQFSIDEDQACAPTSQFDPAAFGVNLPNEIAHPIVIDDVSAVGATNLELGEVKLMKVTATQRLLIDRYPPTDQFETEWLGAFDAAGGVVPAQEPAFDLVVEASPVDSAHDATLDGIRIDYTVGGERFTARTHLRLLLKARGEC